MEVMNNILPRLMVDTLPSRDLPDCVDDDVETTASHMEIMKSEENRLASFNDWPANMSQQPRDLAQAGLFYTHTGDRVQCPFCYGVLKKWLPSDSPLSEHSRHFPQCRFIRGLNVGNIPRMSLNIPPLNQLSHVNTSVYRPSPSSPVNIIPPHNTCIVTGSEYNTGSGYNTRSVYNTGTGCNTGNGCNTGAVHIHHMVSPNRIPDDADLTKEDNRLATYTDWPKSCHQTPEQLARAGLYFFPSEEKPDRVKCAYCHGKLYNWQAGDDPWMEHAKCFPTCRYITLCLGADIIRDLQTPSHAASSSRNVGGETRVSSPSTTVTPTNRPVETTASTVPSSTRPVNTNTRTPETRTNDLHEYLRSEPVQAVLEMGFGEDLVTQTVEQCLRERPGDLPHAAELASMVMALEETPAAAVPVRAPTPLQRLMAAGGRQTHTIPATPETSRVSTGVAQAYNTNKLNTSHHATGPTWTHYRDPALNPAIIREENTRLKDKYLCKVCFENQVRVTFTPCGHLACCGPCSMAMSECPICRTAISGCVRTFF
ncbi:baculoviral IAP repeat-containing protein 7-like [Haliotis cracherodii]|uniref:baculoviral IAP repeat-containing protein 7-like n=1 Tax=Haliotis cracherodii TaxID=6455 RepID=UPI0039E8ECA5